MCTPQMKRHSEAAGSLETDGQKILCFLPVPGGAFLCSQNTLAVLHRPKCVRVTENAGLSPNVSYSNTYINGIDSKTYGSTWNL